MSMVNCFSPESNAKLSFGDEEVVIPVNPSNSYYDPNYSNPTSNDLNPFQQFSFDDTTNHLLNNTCASSSSDSSNSSPISFYDTMETLLNQSFFINGKEYCLVEKREYLDLVENCLKRAFESPSSEDDQVSNEKPTKRTKGNILRKEYKIDGTCVMMFVQGNSSFHTTQNVTFEDNKKKKSIKFRLVKGFVNGIEKVQPDEDQSVANVLVTCMKISSKKVFNSNTKGTYKLLFELECLKDKLVERTVETSWQGYTNTKSFKSLDVVGSTVQLVNSKL